ncbi:carbon starvation induced protein CsiD [Burkholderia sp. Bp8963]|uniref:carbon starvation induced protein CsiD n=1 Tax=Burkholderia sp. Bp8963 TaxID=2184547 RepID=UPI0021AB55C9|nr:carbon starvation induced protein CsiD [Burkholderia sp. Bp8963]
MRDPKLMQHPREHAAAHARCHRPDPHHTGKASGRQPANREEAAFLRSLSQSMETSAGTKEVSLPVGGLVVLNNYFYLHGRAPFQPNESLFRELMRQRGSFAS